MYTIPDCRKIKHPHQQQNTTRTNQYEIHVENYKKPHITQTSITKATKHLQTIQPTLHIHKTTGATDIKKYIN